MIIAATLSTEKATYFHMTDSDTLAALKDILQSAVIIKETEGLNGTCRALITKIEKDTLLFEGGEEIQSAKVFLDEPTANHSKEEVMEELRKSSTTLLPKTRKTSGEELRVPFKKIPGQTIILMRHSLHQHDTLTADGKALVAKRAEELQAQLQAGTIKVVCTPASRCVQTAQMMAAALGTAAITINHEDVIRLVASSPNTDFLIVSHKPTLKEWSSDLEDYFSPKMGEFRIFQM